MAHLWGFGVAQDLGTFQGAVGYITCRGRAGDVFHMFASRGRDVNGEFRSAGHRLRGLAAPSAHDGARLGIVEVVVVSGWRSGTQVTVVDAGGRHGITVGGVGGATRAGGGVRRGVDILHFEGSLQSCVHRTEEGDY